MTILCTSLFQYEAKLNLVDKYNAHFIVTSNEIACRKSGRLGPEQVFSFSIPANISNIFKTWEDIFITQNNPCIFKSKGFKYP